MPDIAIDDIWFGRTDCNGRWSLADGRVKMGAFTFTAHVHVDAHVVCPPELRDEAIKHEIASRLRIMVLDKLAARWSEKTAWQATLLGQDHRRATEPAA